MISIYSLYEKVTPVTISMQVDFFSKVFLNLDIIFTIFELVQQILQKWSLLNYKEFNYNWILWLWTQSDCKLTTNLIWIQPLFAFVICEHTNYPTLILYVIICFLFTRVSQQTSLLTMMNWDFGWYLRNDILLYKT